jgi:hypothetical protein
VLTSPIGNSFGQLTVLSRAGSDRFGRARWNVRCECGTETVVAMFRMTSGHTKSCGCIKGKANFRHGMKGTPTHNSWCAMKQRCNYEGSDEFQRYGAAGITVCERWLNSFENFLEDMGERPDGMTLDRIDNGKGYEPGNCRWATHHEQRMNQERMKC